MLRCIAIDDEPLALDLLEDNIRKLPYLQLVAKCSDAFEAMKVMEQEKIDLIFVDIQMPGMTGLQFIESLVHKPMLILITAYKQYALEAFNLNVVDYLVKPVELNRFVAACNKANELFQLRNSPKRANTPAEFFFVNSDYSLVKVIFSEISWIEGLKDYLKIHFKAAGKPLLTRMSMKDMEEALPARNFIRIHKSYIVAVASIRSVKKSSVFIGEMELPVGDTFKDSIQQLTGRKD